MDASRRAPPRAPSRAVAAAAFTVLDGLFPLQHATLQARYDTFLAGVADLPAGAKQAGTSVWSSVRFVLPIEPISFTSLSDHGDPRGRLRRQSADRR